MILNFKLENGAFAPKNEHSLDAGYDLISPVDLKIKPKKRGFINTGVCVQATNIPKGFKFEGKIEGTSGNAKKSHRLCLVIFRIRQNSLSTWRMLILITKKSASRLM